MTRSNSDGVPCPQGSPRSSNASSTVGMILVTQRNLQHSKTDVVNNSSNYFLRKSKSNLIKKKMCTYILVAVFLLVFLDVVILQPNFSYINEECYLSKERLHDLRTALFTISEIYEKYNQTYWLDYGTLLGAYRMGDILPHDGDADISRLIPPDFTQEQEEAFMDHFAFELHQKIGAVTNWQKQVTYKTITVDLARWVLDENKYVYRFIPGHPIYTQFRRNFPGKPLSSLWFIPTGKIKLYNKMLGAPRDVDSVLQYHYGSSVNITLAYKWRCWFRNLFEASANKS